MQFVRIMNANNQVNAWFDSKANEQSQLKALGVKPATRENYSISVFSVSGEQELLETACANVQISPGVIRKRYGLIVTSEDCDRAGVRFRPDQEGNTGIVQVDARHVQLSGSESAFRKLCQVLLERICSAESRLRLYAELALLVQLKLFVHSPILIDYAAIERCKEVLDKSGVPLRVEGRYGKLSVERDGRPLCLLGP